MRESSRGRFHCSASITHGHFFGIEIILILVIFFICFRSDGPLIIAMKQGAWLLLDELNLASQSVLEGLNALLDHRGEMFIPELNSTVRCKPGFRLFGAQNPVQEGGGRKGLPRSFLNRFIRVNVHAFARADMVQIASTLI